MFCPKCGTSLPDNAKFCAKCGATLGRAPAQTPPASRQVTANATSGGVASADIDAGKPNPGVIVAIAVIAIVVIVGVLAFVNHWGPFGSSEGGANGVAASPRVASYNPVESIGAKLSDIAKYDEREQASFLEHLQQVDEEIYGRYSQDDDMYKLFEELNNFDFVSPSSESDAASMVKRASQANPWYLTCGPGSASYSAYRVLEGLTCEGVAEVIGQLSDYDQIVVKKYMDADESFVGSARKLDESITTFEMHPNGDDLYYVNVYTSLLGENEFLNMDVIEQEFEDEYFGEAKPSDSAYAEVYRYPNPGEAAKAEHAEALAAGETTYRTPKGGAWHFMTTAGDELFTYADELEDVGPFINGHAIADKYTYDYDEKWKETSNETHHCIIFDKKGNIVKDLTDDLNALEDDGYRYEGLTNVSHCAYNEFGYGELHYSTDWRDRFVILDEEGTIIYSWKDFQAGLEAGEEYSDPGIAWTPQGKLVISDSSSESSTVQLIDLPSKTTVQQVRFDKSIDLERDYFGDSYYWTGEKVVRNYSGNVIFDANSLVDEEFDEMTIVVCSRDGDNTVGILGKHGGKAGTGMYDFGKSEWIIDCEPRDWTFVSGYDHGVAEVHSSGYGLITRLGYPIISDMSRLDHYDGDWWVIVGSQTESDMLYNAVTDKSVALGNYWWTR